jgi:hypothetical protein
METELVNHIMQIKEALGGVHARLDGQDRVLNSIESQTIKTNGRVTSLEKTCEMLAITTTQNSGLLKVVQDNIKSLQDSNGLSEREINELKKIKTDDVEIKKEKVKAHSTLGVAIIGAISGLIALFK